ncbi:MAG TPA: copper resistance system multicopper oxidase [Magnetospirillaceae bacterium]|nr:copper resistance system multicopper oxidase [Magnetospirillaceae bacterium]
MSIVSRRRLLQGAGILGVGSALRPLLAAADPGRPVLSGSHFDLEIAEVPILVGGRKSIATAVNGMVPAPILRWREGDEVTISVTNRLKVPTSIHWHGIRVPTAMDGIPGLSFPGIAPGETFTYRFPVKQSGTYWYHSHSAYQEQTGLYGPIVIEPAGGFAEKFDRDYVVLLSEWSAEDPADILSNLKFQSDYYNYGRRTAGSFLDDAKRDGLDATIAERLEWGRMRMAPTDILDVSGATYRYLVNGQVPEANWTALFRPGERVRLRIINAASMSIFDLRIPDLPMSVIQADGNDVEPVMVDQFRIAPAETYDVIVEPRDDRPYTLFAQAEDRSGYARATLSPRLGLEAPVPPMDPRPLRSMADMGMAGMAGMDMHSMHHGPAAVDQGVEVDNVAMMPTPRLAEPGDAPEGRRVLTYADLRATRPGLDPRPPSREVTLHLTGNMERFIWGFDGKKFTEAGPIELQHGERVRIILVNDTMMEHPLHLHGLWSELDNGQDAFRPYKHTINVKPGETLSFLVTADEPGRWAFHCHLLFHMATGMFREVRVS